METSNYTDKKISFDDLSREELIKKCKTFLTIVQKAKQSKHLLQEEIEQLKAKAENSEKELPAAVNELIQDLTQQKLNLVSTTEDLKLKNESLVTNLNQYKEEKKRLDTELNRLDNENIAYKKQVTRLTDENDQLITHLDSLERQIEELNRIGLDQQKQLLRLEENNKPQVNPKQNEKIQELEKMLSISLEEIKRLKSENSVPDTNITELNERLRSKLKNYHSKIVKLAVNIKQLKADKDEILDQFKTYTEQVRDWRDKLNVASEKFLTSMRKYETENEELKGLNFNFMEQLEAYKINDKKTVEEMNELKERNTVLMIELKKSKDELTDVQNENNVLKTRYDKLNEEMEEYRISMLKEKQQFEDKINSFIDQKEKLNAHSIFNEDQLRANIKEKEEEIRLLHEEIQNARDKFEKIELENAHLNEKISEILNEHKETELKFEEKIEHLSDELKKSLATEKQLAEKSSEEMLKLVREIEILTENSTKLQEKLEEFEQREMRNRGKLVNADIQTENGFVPSEELQEEILMLRNENTQLLSEMNEMNQELKERGENISKLEAHCEEIKKKIQVYETQANKNVNNITEKEETIKELQAEISSLKIINENNKFQDRDLEIIKLKNEIENLKERINANNENSNYAECDFMSTSTISRTEEMERLKDLEGSWEEKYSKLKSLAIKLKAKLKEQTNESNKEKTELQQKLNNTFDNIKTLQMQHDQLGEQLENYKITCAEYSRKIEEGVKNISLKDDQITKLQSEIEEFVKDKANMDIWKKQIASKVQALRKEVEEKKTLEGKLSKLTAELEAKEEALKLERENHRQTKNSLQHSTNENKKNTVLNLEMQDYEKSVKELSQKLEKKTEHITKLKGQIDSQKGIITALRDQNGILEEKIKIHENDLNTSVNESVAYKKKIVELENILQIKEEEILNQMQQLESIRSQNEELSTELSKDIAEHQKIVNTLKEEKEALYLQNLNTQQMNREIQEKLSVKEEEFSIISKEYENYKIRAQSVLRQNQNRDIGLEEKLSGDVSSLTSQVECLNSELVVLRNNNEALEKDNETLKNQQNLLSVKYETASNEIQQLKTQHDQLLAKYNQAVHEHNETVRSLKVHAETLGQCYRQQLSEQEVRHNREIVELQSKMEKAPSPDVTLPTLPTMTREEGEGSESTDSTNNMPVSLEKLLGGEEDHKISLLKKQLNEQESKLTHLTDILADTEQDLAKHVQMNKVLKEEIRRQQRAVEREKHAENLEYLKNVVFKFITLSSGDERVRLVPVLNTILKLSPEETRRLDSVAKGDPGLKAWSAYLPSWSSPNKP